MKSFFSMFKGNNNVPDWASFLNSEEFNKFISAVNAYFKEHSQEFVMHF